MNQKPQKINQDEKKKFRQFSYLLAWISFISAIGSAVFTAIKDKEPPNKDDYYK